MDYRQNTHADRGHGDYESEKEGLPINTKLLNALLIFARATNHTDPRDILERDAPILPLFAKIKHVGDEWWVMSADGVEIRDVFLTEQAAIRAARRL